MAGKTRSSSMAEDTAVSFAKHMDNYIKNSEVSYDSILIPGYSLPLRKDRVGKRGGGVAIYAKDHIAVKRRVEFEYAARVRTPLGSMQC